MTTATYCPPRNGFGWYIVLALAIVVAILALQAAASGHAVARHGDVASRICNELGSGNALITMINPYNGRQAQVCQIGPELFAVGIFERNGDNVTAFPKPKMSRLSQVLQYLRNQGYR